MRLLVTGSQMFITGLFVKAKNWNPSVFLWVNYKTHTTLSSTPLNELLLSSKNEVLLHTTNWMTLQEICFAKVNPQYLPIVWVHVHNIFEMTNLKTWRTDELPGVRENMQVGGNEIGFKRTTGGILMVMKLFFVLTVCMWYHSIVLQ